MNSTLRFLTCEHLQSFPQPLETWRFLGQHGAKLRSPSMWSVEKEVPDVYSYYIAWKLVKQWFQCTRRAYKGVQEAWESMWLCVMNVITCKACKQYITCITCVTWVYSVGESLTYMRVLHEFTRISKHLCALTQIYMHYMQNWWTLRFETVSRSGHDSGAHKFTCITCKTGGPSVFEKLYVTHVIWFDLM